MPTLAQLRLRVREKCDLEDDSRFVDNAELNGYLNRALWALDDVLHATWEDYYLKTATLTASGDSLTLPADFFKLVAVDRQVSGQWGAMLPWVLAQRNELRNITLATPSNTQAQVRYRLQGNTLQFLPTLTPALSLVISYYPQAAELVVDSDSRTYPNGWEEWAVLRAALACLIKEERDYSGVKTLWELEDARVRASAPLREETPPPVDVAGDTWVDGISPWRRRP